MSRHLAIFVACVLSLSLAACGGEPESSVAPGEASASQAADFLTGVVGPRGKADASGYALDAELGGRYRFALQKKAKSASVSAANARVLRLGKMSSGQTIAVVLRRVSGDALNAYVAVFENGDRMAGLGYSGVQGIAPMAAESDEVVIFTTRDGASYDVFVADAELRATATVQVDIVALSTTPRVDVNVTTPGIRVYAEHLRELEGQVDDHLLSGALAESEGGLVATDATKVSSLKERVALMRFAQNVNGYRAGLYQQLVRATVGDGGELATETATGVLCAELWTALRTEGHRIDPS